MYATKDVHIWIDEGGSVSKSAFGAFSNNLNLLNPAHVLDIQYWNRIITSFILEVMRTKVTAEKYH